MRKLVTLRRIAAINPIPNADAIEVATVDGWNVVVKKGEFEVGEVVVYFEIDSILPKGRPEFEFLMARGCKMQPAEDGSLLEGHRLRTIKLRGQVSQGLIIPLPSGVDVVNDLDRFPHCEQTADGTFGAIFPLHNPEDGFEFYDFRTDEEDLADLFDVKKYEKPIPAQLAGMCRGNYPEWLPKTDQERVQNCFSKLPRTKYIMEEKLEGSSMTVYHNGETVGVTSRNLDLKLDQEGNTFVDTAQASGLLAALERWAAANPGSRIAIRGELIGPNIQGNIYGLTKHEYHIYDVYLSNDQGSGYLDTDERFLFVLNWLSDMVDHTIVQNVRSYGHFDLNDDHQVDDIVALATGESFLAPVLREGIVFKSVEKYTDRHGSRVISFKAISPEYLLKEKD